MFKGVFVPLLLSCSIFKAIRKVVLKFNNVFVLKGNVTVEENILKN